MSLSLIEQAKVEMRMGKAARAATEASSAKNRRKFVGQLFEIAAKHAHEMELLEPSNDPRDIALGALVLVTQDVRVLYYEVSPDEVDINDAYYQSLRLRQSNFLEAALILDEVIASN